jgi:ParB family chromosome partitioning protein
VQQPRRLGKGLDSLLAESSEAVGGQADVKSAAIIELPIEKVFPNPDQPRKEFDETALAELSSSIQEKGVIQPILVLSRPDGTFMIIAGERRYRASKLAGRASIPAIVKTYTVEETMEVALIENLQREDLNPLEEAIAFRSLIDRFNLSQEEIAQKIGKNRATVANSLRLLKLPESIQQGIASNSISAGHARALLAVKNDEAARESLYQAIVERGLSVRDAEWIAQSINGGSSFMEASIQRLQVPAAGNGDGLALPLEGGVADVMDLTRGATIKPSQTSDGKTLASDNKRAPELWDLEEKLIVALGTKVQIKGDTKGGRIEITYFSADDLDRLHELLVRKT